MKRLPYGYRWIRGQIVVDEDAAKRLTLFFRRYIDGASVEDAALSAGLPMSGAACRAMLTNRVYLGTDELPPILTEQVMDAAEREAKRRGARLVGKAMPRVPPLQAATSFVLRLTADAPEESVTPEDYAAWLYDQIQPASNHHDEGGAVSAWPLK